MNNTIHYFDISVATEIGIIPAILYQNISYWVDKNKANDRNFHDGYYWTFNSVKAFEELFPYLTQKQIRSSLDKLEELGIIKTGNYNKLSFDRTKWYTIAKDAESNCLRSKSHLPTEEIPFAPQGRTIPDINTDINSDNKNIVEQSSTTYPFSEIVDYLNKKADTQYRASSKKTQSLIKARINEGFTLEDFKTVIGKKTTEWKSDNKMSAYLRPETLFGTKFESYLNQKIVNPSAESGKIVIKKAHDEKPPEVKLTPEERAAMIAKIRGNGNE